MSTAHIHEILGGSIIVRVVVYTNGDAREVASVLIRQRSDHSSDDVAFHLSGEGSFKRAAALAAQIAEATDLEFVTIVVYADEVNLTPMQLKPTLVTDEIVQSVREVVRRAVSHVKGEGQGT